MAKFLFVYRGSGDAEAKMTPDEMQQVMQKWGDWIGEAMAKGWMVERRRRPDHGRARGQRAKSRHRWPVRRIQGDRRRLFDRRGRTIDAAAELAKGCPGLLYGGKVEVRALAGLAEQL